MRVGIREAAGSSAHTGKLAAVEAAEGVSQRVAELDGHRDGAPKHRRELQRQLLQIAIRQPPLACG